MPQRIIASQLSEVFLCFIWQIIVWMNGIISHKNHTTYIQFVGKCNDLFRNAIGTVILVYAEMN